MGAIFILLAVGALIGTWNMAGTIPTVVSYGIALLRPAIFYAAVALICAVVGAVTGSSWTTAGTLGVAFIGMAPILGMSTTIAAGAIISGAYMGDKMSPLSETTVLVPSLVGGVTVNEHIRGMVWTVGPVVRHRVPRLPRDRHRRRSRRRRPSVSTRPATSWRRRSTSRRSTCCRSCC